MDQSYVYLFFKNVLFQITLFGIFLLSVVCMFPITIPVASIVFFYRWLVIKVAKRMDPTLASPLTPIDTIVASRTPYTKPFCTLVQGSYVSETVDKDQVLRTLQANILQPKFNDGNCIYPQLKQRMVTRFGFKFWKTTDNFSIHNHVRYWSDENNSDQPVDSKETMHIMEKLVSLPFNESHSPWEIVIVRNFQCVKKPSTKSIIFLRVHHCFFDGMGINNFMGKLSHGSPKFRKFEPKMPNNFVLALSFVFWQLPLIPYVGLKYLITGDYNSWTDQKLKNSDGKFRMGESDPIEMSRLKEIQLKYNTTMTTVMFTAFTGGFLKLMKRHKENTQQFRYILPIPVLHPDKLENHFSGGFIVGKNYGSNVLQTMKHIEAEMARLRHSVLVPGFPHLARFVGSLPLWLIPHPSYFLENTLMLSSFPGPYEKTDVFGYRLEACIGAINPLAGVGINSIANTYDGVYRYALIGDSSIFRDEQDLEAFSSGIMETIEELRSHK